MSNTSRCPHSRTPLRDVQKRYLEMAGRKLGCKSDGKMRLGMERFRKGNRKISKPPKEISDQWKIKQHLNLKPSKEHRLYWGIWCTIFQAVCRASDITVPEDEEWNPRLHATRAHITPEHALDRSGKVVGAKLTIQLNKTKTSNGTTKETRKPLIRDDSPNAVSAAVAISRMIDGDPAKTEDNLTPLFRNPDTKKAVKVWEARRILKQFLEKAGIKDVAATHSLKESGAAAYFASDKGVVDVAKRMGN